MLRITKVVTVIAIFALALCAPAKPQLMLTGAGSNQAGGGSLPTPCNAGQLDYSLSTGCNVVFYVNGVSSP